MRKAVIPVATCNIIDYGGRQTPHKSMQSAMNVSSNFVLSITLLFMAACSDEQKSAAANNERHKNQKRSNTDSGLTPSNPLGSNSVPEFQDIDLKTSTFELVVSSIRNSSPSEFDNIWDRLKELDDGEIKLTLQATAIYFLAAGQDLARCASVANEKMGPGIDRKEVMTHCVFLSSPTSLQILAFFRNLHHQDERRYLHDILTAKIDGSTDFSALKDAGIRLNEEESKLFTNGLIQNIFQPFTDKDTETILSESLHAYLMIKQFENESLFPGTSSSDFLRGASLSNPNAIFALVPDSEQLIQILGAEGFGEVVRSISMSDPGRFFGPGGIRLLPDSRVSNAWNGWLTKDSDSASNWFSKNQNKLSTNQFDQISASFARFAASKDEVDTAIQWASQVKNNGLRESILENLGQRIKQGNE